MRHLLALVFGILYTFHTSAQTKGIDYDNIYKYGLDGEIGESIDIIKSYDSLILKTEDKTFVANFKKRFFYEKDVSDYLEKRSSKMDSLLVIYRDYWRESLISPNNYDSLLVSNVYDFLKRKYPKTDNDEDSLDTYLKKYLGTLKYNTTGFGKTGKLYDLLVWKTEEDTTYHIKNKAMDLSVHVVFMEDFISSGWADYATLGKYYPSGWATDDKLYCVKHKYDLNSEKFLVSFLSHEGQHFEDYKIFKNLSSPELEYRAKLIELSSADTTLYDLIEFFIKNSNQQSKNGHSKANYDVIRDLSQHYFKRDFEDNLEKWKKIKKQKINKTALKLLKENSRSLKKEETNINNKI